MLVTGCLKSDEPVLFQDAQVLSFEDSPLGLAVGRVYPNGRPTQAYQLRREGEQTYLYICRRVALGAPPPEIQKVRAFVSAIPGNEGFYAISLEEGNFISEQGSVGHDLVVVEPKENHINIETINSVVAPSMINRHFGNTQPIDTTRHSQTYSASLIQNFLIDHLGEYIDIVGGDSSYSYFQGELTSCDY